MSTEVQMDLDTAVAEVLGQLTGLDLTYDPELDRYRAVTRALNRALRANALEAEWSCYATTKSLGASASCGDTSVSIGRELRPRIINDDAVRLVDAHGQPQVWAYFLPRDAIHKYSDRPGLWVAAEADRLRFSRPFTEAEAELEIHVPVMREPRMFRLPETGTTVPPRIRKQLVDFSYPDLIISRASYYYAMSDPVMQPRAQTLESEYKGLMYQLMERDSQHTDTPYSNEFILPLENGLTGDPQRHRHPHSNANW